MTIEVQNDDILKAKILLLEGFISQDDFRALMQQHTKTASRWIVRSEATKFISTGDLEWLSSYIREQKMAFVLSKDFFSKEKISTLNEGVEHQKSLRFFNHILEARAWLSASMEVK